MAWGSFPLISVAETTETAAASVGGSKASWISKGFPAVYAKWPRLRGVIWFNRYAAGQKVDWRLYGGAIGQTPAIPASVTAAYRTIAMNRSFQAPAP